MTSIKIYKYNGQFYICLPVITDDVLLDKLRNTMLLNIVHVDIIEEYTLWVTDDFKFENFTMEQISAFCHSSNKHLVRHFVSYIEHLRK